MFLDSNTQYYPNSVLPNLTSRFNAISIKIPASYFVDIDKWILKFTWRGKRPSTANAILKENNRVGELMLPNFKTHYKSYNIQDCVILVREKTNRLMEQNREPRNRPTEIWSPDL